MDKKESDDYEFEFQKLVEHHKAEIDASGMSRDELINLLARNLASYNFLCRSYEERSHQFEEAIKMRAQTCDLLEKRNAEIERKFFAAVNALPKAVEAAIQAGMEVSKTKASKIAKAAAKARHSKPGSSLDKQAAIRAIWATGKYANRDLCAEQECAALGMAFGTARRALRGTPDPA